MLLALDSREWFKQEFQWESKKDFSRDVWGPSKALSYPCPLPGEKKGKRLEWKTSRPTCYNTTRSKPILDR